MKKCPRCNDFAIYEDSVNDCPVCGARLCPYTVSYAQTESPSLGRSRNEDVIRPARRSVRSQDQGAGGARTGDNRATGGGGDQSGQAGRRNDGSQNRNAVPPFETRKGGLHIFRGAITEISHQIREQSVLERFAGSVFRGEPYRVGDDMRQCVIRIEEFTTGRRATQMRDIVFRGDAEGRFIVGDDVTIAAVRCGGDYFATRMDVHTTGNRLQPAHRIPALAMRLLFVGILCLAAVVVMSVYGFFAHGGPEALMIGLTNGMLRIVVALLPILVPLLLVWYFFGRFFRRRRR
jgi:hypothetical protein